MPNYSQLRMKTTSNQFQQSRYFDNLDGLRALAIFGVLLCHAPRFSQWSDTFQENGRYGVSLFFVISGLLISSLLIRERATNGTVNLLNFYIRRGLRLYPLYYSMLALECVMVFGLGFYKPENQVLFREKLPSYLFYYSNLLPTATEGPFFYAWSLAVEEQFYLIFALAAKWLKLRTIMIVSFVLLAVKVAYFNLTWGTPNFDATVFRLAFSYQEPILIGVILGVLAHDERSFGLLQRFIGNRGLGAASAVGLVALWALVPLHHKSGLVTLLAYIMMGVVVWQGSVGAPWPIIGGKALVFVGRISYGVYLFHMLCKNLVNKLPVVHESPVAVFVLYVPLTLVIASLSYWYFESPLLKLKSRFQPQHGNIERERLATAPKALLNT